MLLLYVVALECHIVNEPTTKLKGKRLQPGWQSPEAFRVANRDHYEVGTAALDQSSQTRSQHSCDISAEWEITYAVWELILS
eukprot:s9788_g2.t1